MDTKHVLITGAANGIGFELFSHLSSMGYKIYVIDKDAKKLKELSEKYPNHNFYACDLSKVQETISVLDLIKQDSDNSIDILINNAAIIKRKNFLELTYQEWEAHININLNACFYISQFVGKIMAERKSGNIINISSISSFFFDFNRPQLPYSATKAALDVMTKNLALELGKYGIRVNSIQPGFIECGMSKNLPERVALLERTPLKRLGSADDIMSCVEYLVNTKSSFITGQTIAIDGGYSLGL